MLGGTCALIGFLFTRFREVTARTIALDGSYVALVMFVVVGKGACQCPHLGKRGWFPSPCSPEKQWVQRVSLDTHEFQPVWSHGGAFQSNRLKLLIK